eukprot:m.108635 g.108635  ORF g.108635 m.108635 type:complete len:258 (+) comp51745_c0_seq5:403-1176(+)
MGDVQRTPSEEDLQHMTQHEPRLHAAIRVASVGGAKQEGSGAAAAPGMVSSEEFLEAAQANSSLLTVEGTRFYEIPLSSWEDTNVEAWLLSLKLKGKIDPFRNAGINGVRLTQLTTEDLILLDVRIPAQQQLILDSLARLKPNSSTQRQSISVGALRGDPRAPADSSARTQASTAFDASASLSANLPNSPGTSELFTLFYKEDPQQSALLPVPGMCFQTVSVTSHSSGLHMVQLKELPATYARDSSAASLENVVSDA